MFNSFEGNRAWGGALKLINSSAFSCLPHHHMYLYWQYLHHRSLIGILPALCCSCVLQSFLWKLICFRDPSSFQIFSNHIQIFKWIIIVSTIRHILGLIHTCCILKSAANWSFQSISLFGPHSIHKSVGRLEEFPCCW